MQASVHSRMGVMAAIVAATWVVLQPAVARADAKAEAADKFKQGVSLWKAEKYQDALEAFLESNKLFFHPDTVVNIANCYAELYEFAKAMKYFEIYIEQKGSKITADQKKEVDDKMERIGKKVGKLTVSPEDAGGKLLVDGEDQGTLPLDGAVYVEAGLHKVTVKQGGSVVFEKEVNVIGGSVTAVEVKAGGSSDGDDGGNDVEDGGTGDPDEDATVEEDGEGDGDDEDDVKPVEKPKKKKKGILKVEIAGAEAAKVYVNGEEVGEGPYEDQFKSGSYEIKVEAPGKPRWKGEVEVKAGKTTLVSVDLAATKKMPAVNPMFYSMLGATVMTAVGGAVIAIFANKTNKEASALFDDLNAGLYDPPRATNETKNNVIDVQNKLVDIGDSESKAATALFIVSGVFAAATVASIFIFREEKPASKGSFEISTVSPYVDPATGSAGIGLSASF